MKFLWIRWLLSAILRRFSLRMISSSAYCTRIGWVVAVFMFVPLLAEGQIPGEDASETASVRGFVTDAESGQPLAGANVTARRDGEVVRGMAASRDGSFLLTNLEPATYELRVTFVGYEPRVDTLVLDPGESRAVEATLTPVSAEVGEVLVQAEDRAGAAQVQSGFQRIEAEDLRRIPTPGLSEDLAGYLTSQPGVVSLGDRGGGLYIRGGEPSQNRLYVDRMPVYQPFHMLGFYSSVPASIVQETDIYAGGYPATYSGGLSSIIDVNSRTGNMSEFGSTVTVSPFMSSVTVDGPLARENLSFLGSARTSTLDWGASNYVDQPLPFSFSDAFGKLYLRPSASKRLIVSSLWSRDQGSLGLAPADSSDQQIRWHNFGTSLRYLFLPSALSMQAELFLAYSKLGSELGPRQAPIRTSNLGNLRMGADATFPGEYFSVDAGFGIDFINIDTEIGGFFQNVQTDAAPGLQQAAFYVSPALEVPLGGTLRIEPGVRAQFYHVRFDPYLEPRLRVAYQRGVHELSVAGGLFHQELLGLNDRRDAASVFTAWTAIPRPDDGDERGGVLEGRIGEAVHGAASYRIEPSSAVEIAVGGFYRELSNLFVQEWTALPQLSTDLQPADGRSLGLDLRVELQRGPFYGFVNYGYSDTRYAMRDARFDLWYGRETMEFRPPHDQRHQVNVLMEMSQWGFTLTTRWGYGSGRPYSRPIGFDGFVFVDRIQNQFRVDGDRRVIYERPFNAVLPSYHRLDVSLERPFQLASGVELSVQGSLINTYDRSNIFFLDAFTLERRNQLPLVPSLGLELVLG